MKILIMLAIMALQSCTLMNNKEKTIVSNAEAYNSCMVGMRNILTAEFGEKEAGIIGKERCLSFIAPVMTKIRDGFYNDDSGKSDNEEFSMDTIRKVCLYPAEKVMLEMQSYYKRFFRSEYYSYEVNKHTIAKMCPDDELRKFGTIYKTAKD